MADITFTGNVGKEPEFEFLQSGRAKLAFSVADSKSKPDGNGGWEKLAEQWLRVTVWGPLAEHLNDQITKGSRVKVYGEFYAREYEGKNGKGVSLDVTAEGVKVFPPKGNRQDTHGGNGFGANAGGFGGNHGATGNNAPDDPWATPAAQEPPF